MLTDTEGNIKMECKECIVEPQLKSYITIKTGVIASFVLFSTITIPIITSFLYIINDKVSDLETRTQLKLLPMVEKSRQNELRIVRLENINLKLENSIPKIQKSIDVLNTNLKYNFVTNEKFNLELKKKADRNELDARNFKKAYRDE